MFFLRKKYMFVHCLAGELHTEFLKNLDIYI